MRRQQTAADSNITQQTLTDAIGRIKPQPPNSFADKMFDMFNRHQCWQNCSVAERTVCGYCKSSINVNRFWRSDAGCVEVRPNLY
ncbi:hypothetical protein PoB_007400300 [Plakobranchus ocellatus]|uniref:Uncharacterized protein n=1 Tax=Plakobranchus ocellatus TaxID=259542 RepID=A0AAV4DTR9_9GAST|nr:hypothetical protein PoB_007400300 [Plakobranchus ocellatus]